jgi:hypothetical protein
MLGNVRQPAFRSSKSWADSGSAPALNFFWPGARQQHPHSVAGPEPGYGLLQEISALHRHRLNHV